MDDIFPILLFIIFFVVPLLEGLKKKNKNNKQQPPPPPQQRRVPPPAAPSRTEEISTRPRQQESAAGMVPDDLWEILTGQKRPPVLTTPQPTPAENRPHPAWDVVYDPELDQEEEAIEAERESVTLEDVDVEQRRAPREAVSLETLERHPEPIIISLEENIPTVAQRHAAFHKTVTSVPIVDKPRARQRIEFRNRSELQRAMLMMEILGSPKGLE